MHRHFHSPVKRGIFSFLLIAVVMAVGTIGVHITEKMTWIDSFYLMSMVATAQGLAITPSTVAGKLFIALMSFVSVGSVVAALGFIFGPFLGQLWRLEIHKVKQFEQEMLKKKEE
jgi:hypothetical protein